MRKLLELLHAFQAIDRRWLFLAMAIAIVIPLIFPIGLPITPRAEVQAVVSAVEALPPGTKVIVSADYDPASKPELQPFFDAFLDLAFRRDLRLVIITLWPQGPPLIDETLAKASQRHDKVYGVDWVNLGFKEGKIVVMAAVGESMVATFPKDTNGTPVKDIPIMSGVERLSDFPLMVCISSGNPGVYEWVPQVQGRFIDKIVASTTSVIAPDLIPYLGSGQLVGLVGGMAGAAQFEQILEQPGAGSGGMDAQNFAHLLIILAVILANIAYFTSPEFRRKRAQSRRS